MNWTSQFMWCWNRPRALEAAGTTRRGSWLLAWAWPGHFNYLSCPNPQGDFKEKRACRKNVALKAGVVWMAVSNT